MKKLSLFMLMAVGLLISGSMWAGNVAKIGDQEYTSISQAFYALHNVPDGQETTITLLDNCSGKQLYVPENKKVILDLGEYTITSDATSYYAVIDIKGDLTINAAKRDYVDEAGNPQVEWLGGINGGNYYAIDFEYYYQAVNGSKLTINGGKFTVNTRNNAGTNNAIIQCPQNNSQTIVINDGEFIGSGHANFGSIIYVPVSSSAKRDITINGGRFYNEITGYNGGNRCLILLQGTTADLKITGGDFEIKYTAGGYQVVSCIDVRGKNNNVTITGGSFVNSTSADKAVGSFSNFVALFAYEDVSSVSLSNAYFKSVGAAARINAANSGVFKDDVTNVTFESLEDDALDISPYSVGQKYVINGGKFIGKYGIWIWGGKEAASIDIQWCEINASAGYGVVNSMAAVDLSITGGNINGTMGGVYMKTGTLTYGGTASCNGMAIDGGTINIEAGSIISDVQCAVRVNKASTINVIGTPIITSNHTQGISFYNNGGTVAIDGGRFKAPYATVYGQAGSIILSDGIYSLEPVLNDYCAVKTDYKVITNPDPSTVDVYPWAIGKETFNEVVVNEDANRTIDWKTITTWAGGNIIPDKGDDVTIADGKNVEVGKSGKTDAYAHKIIVDNGSDLIIDGGSKLTVGNGGLTIGTEGDGSEIIIKSTAEDGTGVLLFSPVADEAVTTVEATIELHTTAHKDNEGNYFWNYIGIPLKTDNFTAANWEKVPVTEGQETGSYLQTWDFTEGWVNSGLEAFKPFQGVAITNDSKDGVIYRFKGTMVGNADKNMQFKPRGYNFFANSYTAPIDIETLLNELKDNGVVDAAIYMFDTENNRFQSVALSAFAGFIPPYFRVIPSMNGFFILNQQTQVSGQTMDYGDAVYNCALGNRPIYAPAHEAMNFSRVHINVEANGSKDGLYLIENDEFTSEFENGYDVIKYMTAGQSNIYAQTTAGRLSQLFNSNIEGTMVGFEAAANQTMYTLSFDELQGESFMLTDMVTGEMVVMNEDNTYTFFAQAGQNNGNRFMVTRINKAPTAMDNVKGNVKAQGIYSVMGHYFGNVTEWNRLPQGVYVVNGVKVVKY